MAEPADHLIMELHMATDEDRSPMQMISAARLAYYRSVEAAFFELADALVAGCEPPEYQTTV